MHRAWPSFAEGTQAEPAIQAQVESRLLYDCTPATQYAELFVTRSASERAIFLEALRLDKRDHDTGTDVRRL
jgi:hypothetical protein